MLEAENNTARNERGGEDSGQQMRVNSLERENWKLRAVKSKCCDERNFCRWSQCRQCQVASNVPIEEDDELINYIILGIPDPALRDQAYIQRLGTQTDLLEA